MTSPRSPWVASEQEDCSNNTALLTHQKGSIANLRIQARRDCIAALGARASSVRQSDVSSPLVAFRKDTIWFIAILTPFRNPFVSITRTRRSSARRYVAISWQAKRTGFSKAPVRARRGARIERPENPSSFVNPLSSHILVKAWAVTQTDWMRNLDTIHRGVADNCIEIIHPLSMSPHVIEL